MFRAPRCRDTSETGPPCGGLLTPRTPLVPDSGDRWVCSVERDHLAAAPGALQRIADIQQIPAEDAADIITHRHSPHRRRRRWFSSATPGSGTAPDHPILVSVRFTGARGSRTAIVGLSGVDKSTLLALIERFYDRDGGRIELAGVDITALPRTVLRS